MRRLPALAVAALLAFPASALADWAPVEAHIAADGRMRAEITLAVAYWNARGVQGCPSGITAYYATSLAAADGQPYARGGSCNVWFTSQWAVSLRVDAPGHQRDDAVMECTTVFHEVGHALGLQHPDPSNPADPLAGSVMDPAHTAVPWDCRTWARHAYPAYRHPRRPKHYGWVR